MSKEEDSKLIDKQKDQKAKYRMTPRYYTRLNRKDNSILFEIHLPGVRKESVSLKVLPDLMHLEALREMETSDIIYTLSRYFPYEIDPESIDAHCENGLLKFSVKIKDPLAEAVDIKLS
jgi:HSP20 family molecular chaperone IbpA